MRADERIGEKRMGDEMLEAAMGRALERQPAVAVPADFAARVRASLPEQPKTRERRSAAKTAAMAAAAVLVVALCWLAPHARPSFESMAFDVEMLMLAELAGVAGWLATRRFDA